MINVTTLHTSNSNIQNPRLNGGDTMKATQEGNIDLTPYTIQRIVDGTEVYYANSGSTSPLEARDLQRKLTGKKAARKIIYTPPNGIKYSVLLSQRHFEIIAKLSNGQWHQIESFKYIKKETRKPVADARALGLIIHTDQKAKAYRLRGELELYPMGLGVGIPSFYSLLPSLSECKKIEYQKEKAEGVKRKSRIERKAAALDGFIYE